MLRRIFLPFALVLLAVQGVLGQVSLEPADGRLVGSKIRSHLTFLTEHLGFPDGPPVKNALMIGTLGAAEGEIVVLGPIEADAKTYASALAAASEELGSAGHVEWSQEPDGAVARLTWEKGKFGQMSSRQSVRIGDMISRLRAIDPGLLASLRAPKHVKIEDQPAASYSSSKYNYYDITKWPASYVAKVETTLPGWMPAAIVLFVALVPVSTLSGILIGIWISRRESIPIAKRRRLYSKFVNYGAFGSIFLHMPLAMGLMFTGQLNPISDLWFGSATSANVFAPFLFLPILVIAPVATFAGRFEKKLFGPTEAEQVLLPPPPIASEEEKQFAKAKVGVTFAVVAVAMAVILIDTSPLTDKLAFKGVPRLVGFLVILFSSSLTNLFFRGANKRFPTLVDDEELSSQVHILALRFNVRVNSIKLDTSPIGRANCFALVNRAGDVRMSIRAKELLSREERDFILAHELAHIKYRHLQDRFRKIHLPYILCFLPAILMPVAVAARIRFPFSPGILFAPAMLAIPYMFIFGGRLSKRQEYEADRLALETTGDYAVAESALRKMALGTEMPHLHDMDENRTHPALWRRLANLKEAAGVS